MNDAAVLQKVEKLTKTVEHLQERVEDLEACATCRPHLPKMAVNR
jgi:hypothetical protein